MKKIGFYAIFVVLLGVFLYSGFRLLSKFNEYKQIDDAYSEIAELAVRPISTSDCPQETEATWKEVQGSVNSEEAASIEAEACSQTPALQISPPISVDFDLLHAINPDIVGWLYCEGTAINYPVLQGKDNDSYLYHQYDGTYSSGGSIFMDYRCEKTLSDEYTIIYGHNMLADSMFNCLDYFREQDYLEDHSRFFYLTPYGQNYCFDVVCTNLTAYRDELRLFELRDDERKLELIRAEAESDTGLDVSNEDQFVLLATCTYDFRDAKCTLLCKVTPIS